jgi:hypothetical protein
LATLIKINAQCDSTIIVGRASTERPGGRCSVCVRVPASPSPDPALVGGLFIYQAAFGPFRPTCIRRRTFRGTEIYKWKCQNIRALGRVAILRKNKNQRPLKAKIRAHVLILKSEPGSVCAFESVSTIGNFLVCCHGAHSQ